MECYLDNSATTKPCKAAVDAEISALTELYGNPSSLHQKGVDAYMLLEKKPRYDCRKLKSEPRRNIFHPLRHRVKQHRDIRCSRRKKATRQENSHYGFRASER